LWVWGSGLPNRNNCHTIVTCTFPAVPALIGAVTVRCFDQIVERLRDLGAGLPDCRTGDNVRYTMADIALSAFSVFFTQSPSFLGFQEAMETARGHNNARSLFQIQRIPTDNHIRDLLDPVAPEHLFSLFDELYQAFDRHGLPRAMRAVNETRLIALDGTWYFSSQSRNIHCPRCSSMEHANGKVTHFHSAITPVIVSPGHREVIPLRPEFIQPQDGHTKQDCEIAAAKRWLAAHSIRYHTGNDTLLGDDLYAHQPFCRQALLYGYHFFFNCKPASHPYLTKWVEALEKGRDRHELKLRVKNGANRWEHHHYRWANGAPLTDSADALKVNWCEVTITDPEGAVRYRNSFITDWTISAGNVAGLVAAGRARWKIENENNNVLKTRGYHLEHNFGHGKQHLASLLLTMNLLAFALHTLLAVTDDSYQLVRTRVGARQKFFEHLRALTTYLHFETWRALLDFMMKGLEIGPYAVKKS
jgi:hypothetical protein